MAAHNAYHSKGLAKLSPMTSSLSTSKLRMSPIFCISLNIQYGGTWRISFESPRWDESDEVITSDIEPPDVADFLYLIKYLKWRHVTHFIRKPFPSWVRWHHHFPNRTSGCRRFFVSDQIFKMAARDAYHSKALEEMSLMTSSPSTSNLRMSPIFRISLNIKNGSTWRISFESPFRAESDDVITFRIEPPDVADFSYLIKYSKWRHVMHIIRKPSQRWLRWRHHFRHRTSGCRRFVVSH